MMSLENELKKNTVALEAHTAVIQLYLDNNSREPDVVITDQPLIAAAEETVAKAKEELVAPITEVLTEAVAVATAPITTAVLHMTEKAAGATYHQFKDLGWSDEKLIAEGYAVSGTPTDVPPVAPAAPAEALTAEAVNKIAMDKMKVMCDQGASISAIIQERFAGRGIKELTAEELPTFVDLVNALQPAAAA